MSKKLDLCNKVSLLMNAAAPIAASLAKKGIGIKWVCISGDHSASVKLRNLNVYIKDAAVRQAGVDGDNAGVYINPYNGSLYLNVKASCLIGGIAHYRDDVCSIGRYDEGGLVTESYNGSIKRKIYDLDDVLNAEEEVCNLQEKIIKIKSERIPLQWRY